MSSAIAGGVASALGGVASNAGWFVPMLVAAIAYFQYEEFVDPESKTINIPTEGLLTEYDFIVGEIIKENHKNVIVKLLKCD